MLAIPGTQLNRLLSADALVAAVEDAARLLLSGAAVVPDRLHLHWDDNTLLVMPSLAKEIYGTKLVAVCPPNAARGLPVTSGLMVLNDSDTGKTLAIMDAAVLTARRTGAVGAMGVKHLTPTGTTSLGLIGCGVQGTWQAISACAVRPIREVYCLGRSEAVTARFKEAMRIARPSVKVTPCPDVRDLLSRTGVIIAATTSSEPVLPDEPSLLKGKHFFSIGSFRPAMQEFPDSVYRLAGGVVVDSAAAEHEVGDLINPLKKGFFTHAEVVHIGEYVARRRKPSGGTTAFKSVGLAIYDLCVARAFYDEARRLGVGQEVSL